ncbi:MAG: 50S ribosomal protein L9 [Thermodesulfobacteriota bacterium]
MEIVLIKDVDNLGLTGQVVRVADGFARNKLIPARLALEATTGNLKRLEKQRAEFAQRAQKEKERAKDLARQIQALRLTIAQKAGEKDKLYGSVTSMDLAAAMAERNVNVDKRRIKMAEPIKMLGEHEIPIKLHPEVTAVLKVSVIKAE